MVGWIKFVGFPRRENFEVKSYYKVKVNSELVDGHWKIIWKSKAPPRVAFFMWTTVLGEILTMDNLRKKNIIVTEWCCMCKKSGESIDHLLLQCEVALEVWNMIC
jgi:hypothetical protein